MTDLTKNQNLYNAKLLCSPVTYFNDTLKTNHDGIGSFKDIQDKLEDFSTLLHNDLLIFKRVQPIKFQNDSGVYHQRFGLEEYDSRYDQFETSLIYSDHPVELHFKQGDFSVTIPLEINTAYMVNNQIEHTMTSSIDNIITIFSFEVSYMEMKRWYELLKL